MADAGDVARMTAWIALMRSWDVVVREMPGWQSRGLTWSRVPGAFLEHHDASSIKSGEWGALGLILDGTPRGIPGPLSQLQFARCLDDVPKVAVVAAGRASHAGRGGPYGFPDGLVVPLDSMNSYGWGAEVANNGLGEPYRSALHYAIEAGERAFLEVHG